MKKFQVISSTEKHFEGIVFDFVIEDDSIGTEINCLGGKYKIIQNGKILGLVNENQTLMILDITPEPVQEKPKLVINKNVEIFVDNREIHVSEKCTYKELYDFLNIEWQMLNSIPGISVQFPLELRENNNLLLKSNWKLIGFENVSEGSFERHSIDGRSI